MDDYLEKKMVGEKMARISVAKAKEMLDEKAQEKEQTSRNVGIEVRGKNALLKLMKGEQKQAKGNPILQQDIEMSITLMKSFIKEQKLVEKMVKDAYKEELNYCSNCKKQLETLRIESGRPEAQ
jgi:hypothetical protein